MNLKSLLQDAMKTDAGLLWVHLASYLFLSSCIFAGMFGYCSHEIAAFSLALVPFAIVSALFPRTALFEQTRFVAQLVLIAASCLWFSLRMAYQVPVDKSLTESLCLMALGLGLTLSPEYYSYQALVSAIILIAGSTKPRESFVYGIPAVFLCGFFLFGLGRLSALCGKNLPKKLDRIRIGRQIFPLLLEGIVSMAIAVLLIGIFPSPNRPRKGFGVLGVSFENVNNSPELMQKWFRSDKYLPNQNGDRSAFSKSPSSATKDKRAPSTEFMNEEADASSSVGSGAGNPGDELLFTVSSPMKLYWTMSLYDIYDGRKWTASNAMKKQKPFFRNYEASSYTALRQNFTMINWNSRKLCSAFMPESFFIESLYGNSLDSNFYSCQLEDLPSMPFSYSVISRVSSEMPEGAPDSIGLSEPDAWTEKLDRRHYMQIPEKMISARLSDFARNICAESYSPMEKAMGIRDFLRSNFKYEQASGTIPDDKEATDFFLFESKKGNCQHFAVAMTMLARLNGIPARLATGFSPGNYNSLNALFEVHEYHAHAWSQIFIERIGWLSFDATPPGSVISTKRPFILGALQDPFGDEWRIRPPELAKNIFSEKSNQTEGKGGRISEAPKLPSPLHRLAVAIPMEKSEFQRTFRNLSEKYSSELNGEDSLIGSVIGSIIRNVRHMWENLKKAVAKLTNFCASAKGMASISAILALLFIAKISRRIFRHLCKRRRVSICMRRISSLAKYAESNPAFCVDCSYRLTRELLDLSGLPRENNKELFEYGVSLTKCDAVLGRDVISVFMAYSKMRFGIFEPSPSESDGIYHKMLRIRNNLRGNLRKL